MKSVSVSVVSVRESKTYSVLMPVFSLTLTTATDTIHPTSMTMRKPMVSEAESGAWPRRAALRQSSGIMP